MLQTKTSHYFISLTVWYYLIHSNKDPMHLLYEVILHEHLVLSSYKLRNMCLQVPILYHSKSVTRSGPKWHGKGECLLSQSTFIASHHTNSTLVSRVQFPQAHTCTGACTFPSVLVVFTPTCTLCKHDNLQGCENIVTYFSDKILCILIYVLMYFGLLIV